MVCANWKFGLSLFVYWNFYIGKFPVWLIIWGTLSRMWWMVEWRDSDLWLCHWCKAMAFDFLPYHLCKCKPMIFLPCQECKIVTFVWVQLLWWHNDLCFAWLYKECKTLQWGKYSPCFECNHFSDIVIYVLHCPHKRCIETNGMTKTGG